MGKLIAVWGSPGSGKTTFSVKLAEALNSRSKKSAGHKTLVVFTDLTSPVVPVVFPNKKSEDIYSLGSVLVKTDLSPNVIFGGTMFIKDRSDLGYLGYTAGENKFSYPALTEDKIRAFEEQLRLMADFVIVDCVSNPEESLLSKLLLQDADKVIRVCTPNLKCLSYHQSQTQMLTRFGYLPEDHIGVLNITESEQQYSASDLKPRFGKIEYTVPFSSTIREQYMVERQTEQTKDKKFNSAFESIKERLVR